MSRRPKVQEVEQKINQKIKLALSSLDVANQILGDVFVKVQQTIRLRDLESKYLKPSALSTCNQQFKYLIRYPVNQYDKREDDQLLRQEQIQILPPPNVLEELILPFQTSQQNACFDFKSIPSDRYQNDKMKKVTPNQIINFQQSLLYNGSYPDSSLQQKSVQSITKIKRMKKDESPNSNQKKREMNNLQIPLSLDSNNSNQQSDGGIEKLRQKLKKREENERLQAIENEKQLQMQKMMRLLEKQNSKQQQQNISPMKQKTYDYQGQIIVIKQPNVEQLPIFRGVQPSFKTITPIPAQFNKNKQKVQKIIQDFNELKTQETQATQQEDYSDEETNKPKNDAAMKSQQSIFKNPFEEKNHAVSDANFNIKKNMKAGPGVIFSEGRDHKDKGPNYIETFRSFDNCNQNILKLSLDQYNSKFKAQHTIASRVKNYINIKNAENVNEGLRTHTQNSKGTFYDQVATPKHELFSIGEQFSHFERAHNNSRYQNKASTRRSYNQSKRKIDDRSQIIVNSMIDQKEYINSIQSYTCKNISQQNTHHSTVFDQMLAQKQNLRLPTLEQAIMTPNSNHVEISKRSQTTIANPFNLIFRQNNNINNEFEREIQTAGQSKRKRNILSSVMSNQDKVVTSDLELKNQKIKIDNYLKNLAIAGKVGYQTNYVRPRQNGEVTNRNIKSIQQEKFFNDRNQSKFGARQKPMRIILKNNLAQSTYNN